MKKLMVAALAVVAGLAQAETYYFALSGQEGSSSSGFVNADWSLNSDCTGDKVVATEGNDYILINGTMRTIYGPQIGRKTFPGDTLQVGIVGGKSGTLVQCGGGGGGNETVYRKLILANGKYTHWRTYDTIIEGPVEVTATGVFTINEEGASNVNAGHHFTGPFTCASENTTISSAAGAPGYMLTFAGDMTGYRGKVKMSGTKATHSGTNVTLRLATAAKISGSVTLEYGAAIRALTADDVASVGSLSAKDGCRLVVPFDWASGKVGRLEVAGALANVSPADPLIVEMDGAGACEGSVVEGTILEFKDAENALTPDCFAAASFGVAGQGMPPAELSLTEADGQGMRRLSVRVKPLIEQLKSDTITYSGVPVDSAMTNAAGWTVAGAPCPGLDYYCGVQWLNTPYAGGVTNESSAYVFGGDSLTMGDAATLLMYRPGLKVAKMVFLPGGSMIFHMGGGGYKYLFADEVSLPGTVDSKEVGFECYQNSLGTLAAPLTGDGVLRVRGRPTSGNPVGGLRLAGDNSRFGGRFYVYVEDKKTSGVVVAPNLELCEWLQIDDGRQLGGPVAGHSADAPRFDALELRRYSALKVTGDATLDEPTRGVYVNEVGQFDIDGGKTLTLDQQLTVNGELHKKGAGKLVLGGALKFNATADDSPTAGKNLVTVAAGALEVAAAHALDGAAVSFAKGAKLVVRHGIGDRGMVNVKDGSSIALDGDLACEIDVGGLTAADVPLEFAVPLCTVTAATADALRGKLVVASPMRGFKTAVAETANEDGTVTFAANCARTGMTIFVK